MSVDAAPPGPLSVVTWPVRTERLVIRPAVPGDAARSFQIRTQPAVAEWITSRPLDEVAFTEKVNEPAVLATTLIVELDGVVVGDLMVRVEDAWAQAEVKEAAAGVQAELGWVLDPSVSGRGLATEAAAALLAICFGPMGLRRVTALCFAANTASWRVMEKLGMRREQHLVQDSLHRAGVWHDTFGYALLATDWAELRR